MSKQPQNPISFLRTLALVEGVSFLLLVGIAMPLKYLAGRPEAVLWVGWAHGALFVAVCAALLYAVVVTGWPVRRGALVFAAALVPLGPFLVDRRMKRYAREFDATTP